MTRFALLAIVLAGCSVAHADVDVAATPYRCEGISLGAQVADADPAIVAPWRALADDRVTDPAGWITTVASALQDPAPVDGATVEARVRLQHQLLRVATRLEGLRDTPHASDARLAVMARVRAIAPTAGELDALGDAAHPRVSAVLGEEPVERSTRNCVAGRLKHVSRFAGLLAFRPLRDGDDKALVAQLVAFDAAGNPHVTPLVDEIELRRGDDPAATACVVAAGDDGVLRTVAVSDLEETTFVHRRRDDAVGCVDCHARPKSFDAHDVTDAHELASIDRARYGQVDELARETFRLYVAPE